jgi:hypothetical protein
MGQQAKRHRQACTPKQQQRNCKFVSARDEGKKLAGNTSMRSDTTGQVEACHTVGCTVEKHATLLAALVRKHATLQSVQQLVVRSGVIRMQLLP